MGAQDDDNFNPLHHAAYKGNYEMIKLLIEYKASPFTVTR